MGDFSTKNAGGVTFSQLHGATYADIDGDGLQDFITGKRFWSHLDTFIDPDPQGAPVLYVYRTVRNPKAPGGAEFVPELIHNRSGVGSHVAAADLNSDGSPEIITSTKRGTFIFWNNWKKGAVPIADEVSRSHTPEPARPFAAPGATHDHLLREGIHKLLAIKDSDIRLLTLEQCRDAVDKSLHAGGAFSATIPLVSLFYGGFIDVDVVNPTASGQDLFVLSKGHAVAALASIYAELGYFDRSVLSNSRSYASILNGHPGPILPGIQLATGPMGQGFAVAQGFAIAGRESPRFDTYALCGDGEMQEGPIWETVMFAGQKHLDNLCVMIDRNNGQLDLANRMIFPMPDLETVFAAFNWNVHSVDATQYDGLYAALERFRYGPRNGKPTVIVCHATKGHGALSDFLNKHKVTVPDRLLAQEMSLQAEQRKQRAEEFGRFHADLRDYPDGGLVQEALIEIAGDMRLRRRANNVWFAVDRASHRPRGHISRAGEKQAHRLRRDPAAAAGSREGICRQRRRHAVDEGICQRSPGGLDRCRPCEHQRPRGRRCARRPAAGAECRRRRGQHDGHRRGLRGAWAATPGSAPSVRSSTGKSCVESPSATKSGWRRWRRKTGG